MELVLRDLRRGLRGLRRNPLFTSIGVLTLGLGIGANVAIFSVLQSVVLRPLPYPDPERLVVVWPAQNFNKALAEEAGEARLLASAAGISTWSLPMVGEGEPEELVAGVVGVRYFDVLGIAPALGRGFAAEERDPSRSDVVVLSHDFWQRRFGGDPAVIGRVLPIDGYDHTARRVIGVTSARYPVQDEVDIYVPLHQRPGLTVAVDSSWYVNTVLARLAPGVSVEQASAEVAALAARAKARDPGLFQDEAVAAAGVVPLMDHMVGPVRGTLWILLGAVALVLLIACANVSNMLLARNAGRASEVAVRKSLGATRTQLVRESVTESLVLALAGAAAGLIMGVAFLELLGPEVARRLPRGAEIALDAGVLVFTLGVAVASALLFGLLPALRNAARDPLEGLQSSGRRGAVGGGTHRLNRGLVAAEIGLALVLTSGAALVAHSFWRLNQTDVGFEAEGVLAVSVAPPPMRYTGPAATSYYEELLAALDAVPGVADVAAIHLLPLTYANWAFPYVAEDFEPVPAQPLPAANFRVVTPGYFNVMRIPLIDGRDIGPWDRDGTEPVGLVNRAFAELRWPGQDAIGKEVRIFGTMPFTVVGVVEDVRQHALDQPANPEFYRPLAQWPLTAMIAMVRAERPDRAVALAGVLREAVWSVDPDVPIREIRPMTAVRDDSVARSRLVAYLLGGFGVLALLLGALGVYGVMAYIAGTRRLEYGIRAALGAAPAAVQTAALRWGVVPIAAGIVAGVLVTLALGRVVRGFLFEVEPHDPATLALVTLVLAAVAGLATWIPARAASRVDPSEVLKTE